MGCGIVKPTIMRNPPSISDPSNNSGSQSNLLLRYETLENVYRIKLTPPKSSK